MKTNEKFKNNYNENEDSPLIQDESPDQADKFPTSFRYILLNEIGERFSYYGNKSILSIYLNSYMGYSKNTSTSIVHTFNFLAYAFPLLGAYLGDGVLGKFKTILYFSIIYVVGSTFLSVTSIDGITGGEPGHRSPWGIAIALVLIAMGTGGIKPLISTFAGDQLKKNQSHLLEKLFQIFYWCINLGSLLATIFVPLLKRYVGYWLAFGIPAVFLTISTIIFVAGSGSYVKRPVTESILLTAAKVIGFAIKEKLKRLKAKITGTVFYNSFDAINNDDKSWLDSAKVEYDTDVVDSIKCALNVLTVFIPLPFFWALYDQTGSRWTYQAESLDLCVFGKKVTWLCLEAEQIQALNPLFIMMFIPIVEYVIYKPLKSFGINFKPLIKMAIGMWLAVASFIISMFLQIAIDKNPPGTISIWLQLPQYLILTIGEILISIPGLEFAYSEAPPSMKAIIMSGWLLAVSLGNIFVVFIVSAVNLGKQWVEFLVFAAVMSLFIFVFMIIAYRFKSSKPSI
ncbi:hypothetical protein DICPUDRAFT_75405 [Dictyostelium purpureum]|uniref:Uncharacterized protein n=1 Tax=Dictyostelium purpureum TaxID=5786 RepID=F0ZAK6_DICPU|nr:uncharacterized protein DICPUDRAFT_75405 [Dictyostelium purpureum]EGC38989.1 hypothetical protein DICPUDRAFT_75405 [Dictyostelium purpureum]|eukprot:XP_003284442.1 hypothetical protein DICPUDRAFT_75405 [Dictyostelium purpureum]